jgi:hypothetical protein
MKYALILAGVLLMSGCSVLESDAAKFCANDGPAAMKLVGGSSAGTDLATMCAAVGAPLPATVTP